MTKRKHGDLSHGSSGSGTGGGNAPSPQSSRKVQRSQQRKDARTIAAQSLPAVQGTAQGNGGAARPGHGSAGMSGSTGAAAAELSYLGGASRRHLPPQLSVEAALSTRSFQVRAMLAAMASARGAQTTRAWQLLPRHMRRRAASHNLLRLPARLRDKGARELAASKTSAKTRAQVRARDPARTAKLADARRERLRARAARKGARWLETHLWHAKRFHMTRSPDDKISKRWRLEYPLASASSGKGGKQQTSGSKSPQQRASHPPTSVGKNGVPLSAAEPRTGFILPETPHMKAHRASWRSAQQRCIAHDASYDAWVRIRCDARHARIAGGAPAQGEHAGAPEAGAGMQFAATCIARVLQRAGVADGWKEAHQSGSTECATVLLGKPGGRIVRSKTGTLKGKEAASAEEDPVAQGKLDISASEKDAKEQSEQALPSGADSLFAHARLVAPVRVLWLPAASGEAQAQAHRDVLVRCHPAAAPALQLALEQAAHEENELQRIKTRYRRRSLLAQADGNGKAPKRGRGKRGKKVAQGGDGAKEQVSSPLPTGAQAPVEGDYHLELSVCCLPRAAPPDAAVPNGRKAHKLTLRKKTARARGAKISHIEREKVQAHLRMRSAGAGPGAALTRAEAVRVSLAHARGERSPINLKRRQLNARLALAAPGVPSVEAEGFNTFELVGPDSGRLLGGVLRLVEDTPQLKREAFRCITQQVTPAQVPRGMVLALDVHDPRLSFPPKLVPNSAVAETVKPQQVQGEFGAKRGKKRKHHEQSAEGAGEGSVQLAPDTTLSASHFWSRQAAAPVFSKGDIDHRRAKQMLPGARLEPTLEDDIVPVIVIQHTSNSTSPKSKHNERQALHGFTILVPRRWAMIFWHSLVHPGTRVAGQVQVRQQAIEGGRLSFPHDYLGTAAFHAYWAQQAQVLKREWKKRPKGKRTDFDKLGVRFAFGGKDMWTQCMRNGWALAKQDHRLHPALADVVINHKTQPWLISLSSSADGAALRALATSVLVKSSATAHDIAAQLATVLSLPGGAPTVNDVSRLATAMLPVQLVACRRGHFDELSGIFLDDSEHDRQWRQALHSSASEGLADHQESIMALEKRKVDPVRLVGSITSGGVSLTQGKGYAVGSVSFLAFLQTVLRDAAWSPPNFQRKGRNPVDTDGIMLIQARDGSVIRSASTAPLFA